MSLIDQVKATLKCEDTEGPFELYCTRTPGYLWAMFFRTLRIHPIAVTLMSIVIGAAAGWCWSYNDMPHIILGIVCLIWANMYDCADGQLARMTGQRTLIGRILDGFAGDVWFFCIYLGLCLRLTNEPIHFLRDDYVWGWSIWVICAVAGFRCHGRQCAISDYYRNIHLWMVLGTERAELDSFISIDAQYRSLQWTSWSEWFPKLYLFFYRFYCKGQENQCPHFQAFRKAIKEHYPDGNIPQSLRDAFRSGSKPLMPWTNILTFDFRAGVLFISLLIGHPWLYPVVEATIMEYWRFRMIRRHEDLCQQLMIEL